MGCSRIFLIIVFSNLLHQQDARRVQHPIGPSFLSIIETKQKIYYNNLGIRIDCSTTGDPLPVISWFRKVNINDQLLIPVQPSGLIDLFPNGSLFIRPFGEYLKSIHAGIFVCQAKNAAGSIQSLPIQLKPQIYDAYEIEVKNPYGFIQSSVIITCEISPPIASSYLKIIGWLEQWDNQVIELDLQIKTKYNLLANQNLIIHNLTKEDDHRSYACIIQNQIDNQIKQSRYKTLRVRDRSPFGPELSVPNNTEYHGRSGDVIELPCGIASLSTNARISWWKNELKINNLEKKIYQNSLIFQISPSPIDDTGVYTCQVDDEPSGRMTSMMTLTVTVPTQCQLITPQSTIPAGSNLELMCTTNMQTTSSIQWQWYHNSLPLFNQNNRYSIINATREHMGMYQCCFLPTISDLNGCCAQTQIRIINSPPLILSSNPTQIVISPKNHSHDLNCTIYADPIPEVHIYKNGERIPLNNPIQYLPTGDVFLHYPIIVSTINDTGHYECVAENLFGSTALSKDISLENQHPLIQTLTNKTIRSGEELTLRCYASGQPNLHLQWIDQTTELPVNTSSTSPILFTSKLTQSNIYTCRARNTFGETSSRTFLTVENPARILYFSPNQTIEIDQRLNISCSVDGDLDYEVIFKTPTQTKRSENEKNIFMIIDRVQMIDSGLYECYVKNSYSEQRAVSRILVQNHPDQIENLSLDKTQRLFWKQPFDGNSPILRYILRIQYKQGISWSEETIITLEEPNSTNYSFEHIVSKCLISVIIQAVNQIGMSSPSDPLYFQTDNRKLPLAPYNLTARNISSKSVVLTWEYPSIDICNKSTIKFRIEITDPYNRTITRSHSSRLITINQLNSFTFYTLIVYAVNDYGSSIKSKPLVIQTIEDVPLTMVGHLMARLLNSSSISISWTFPENTQTLLHGQFRTFIVSIYENFNMSTLQTIETIHTYLILEEVHSLSRYFISVSICNHFDCGPSSSAIDIKTPSLFRSKTNSPSRSLFDPSTAITRIIHRPSSIQAKIHYLTSNEIGLKIIYPSEIIENLIIDYQISNSSFEDQLTISPPLFHIRLTNLSCGNPYDIRIHAKNSIGSSAIEYLHTKTEGSVPIFIESGDIFETITDNYIILNMNQWLIITCPIISYEIEYYPLENLSQIETNRYLPSINSIRIDHLQSNTEYQLNVKVSSEVGETFQGITFRTKDSHGLILRKNQQMIFIMVCIASFLFTFTIVYLILKKIDLFNNRTTRLKPVVYSNKYYRSYSKSFKSRSESFASEDSQGNINPYAVTNCENYQTVIRPSLTRSGRYFRPIILESSSPHLRDRTVFIPTVSSSTDSGVPPSSPPKTANTRQYSLV